MNAKLGAILWREYRTRVRSRAFLLMTILVPALIGGMVLVQTRIAMSAGDETERLAVVDLSGQVMPALTRGLDQKLPDGAPRYVLTPVAATPATLPAVSDQLRREVLEGEEDGFLVLPADVLRSHRAEYHTRNAAALTQYSLLRAELSAAFLRTELRAQGISPASMAQLLRGVELDQLRVSAGGERRDSGQTAVLAWVLGGLLYGTMIAYGVTVMRGVTEEKTSRVSELLLASVDAFPLMLGKILGIAGMGLTQYAVWCACLAGALVWQRTAANVLGAAALTAVLPHIGASLLASFVAFFLLGFLVYASLYAAIGATVASEQEAQQAQLPVTMLLVVAFVSAGSVLNHPSSPLSVTLSLIPFFSPVLMVMREAVANPPAWQVGLALLLCLATLLVLIQAAAKIYRVGVLMTGKRPTLPELLKWLRYS